MPLFTRSLTAQAQAALRHAPKDQPYPLRLDAPVLHLGPQNPLPLRLLFTHLLCTGRSGSGKTSGVLPALLSTYLRWGFGLLACTFKADDAALFVRIAQQTGRANSLIVVQEGGPWRTNLLTEALAIGGPTAATNATALLMEAVHNRAEGGQRKETDSIWNDATARFISLGLTLQQAAGLPSITLNALKQFGDSLPARDPLGALIWPPGGMLQQCLQRAQANPSADPDAVHACLDYYTLEMTRPGSSRFVSSILGNFVNVFDPFLAPGPARDLFFSDQPSTFSMAMSRQGAIIILAIPASTGGEASRTAQILAKAAWIDAMLTTQGLQPGQRPVAFICDEYQRLCTPRDTLLYEAGRSSLVSALCLTQNIPNLFKAFGPSASEKTVYSLLSGFGTYLACQNHDPETNEFLARVIAKDHTLKQSGGTSWQDSTNTSHGHSSGWSSGFSPGGYQSSSQGGSQTSSGRAQSAGSNTGWREELDYRIQPLVFSQLRPGGPPHSAVDAVVYSSGHRFANGLPYCGATFPQGPLPSTPPRRRRWLW